MRYLKNTGVPMKEKKLFSLEVLDLSGKAWDLSVWV